MTIRQVLATRESLWRIGDRLAYACRWIEAPCDLQDILDGVAQWLVWVDFAADFVDPVTPFAGQPHCNGYARAAWAKILLSLTFLECQLWRVRELIPQRHPLYEATESIRGCTHGLRRDLVEWICAPTYAPESIGLDVEHLDA